MVNGNTTDVQTQTITKFDRLRGAMHDVALFTRPSTVKNIQNITGKAETFVVETCRYEEQGDFIFVECMDENGLVRIALPPKVADAIASQRDSLTSRRRSLAGKRRAANMTDEQKQAARDRLAKGRKKRSKK